LAVVVSAIVCTRNRAHLLGRTLESLADQDFDAARYEIVVVDNGSTDETRRVVESCQAACAIKYVYESVPGLDRARNAGVKAAAGGIIAITDDDVVVHRDWLSTMVAELQADPDVYVVCGKTDGSDGVAAGFSLKLDDERYYLSDHHDIYRSGGQINAGHRKEVFDLVGEFDPDLDVGAKYPAAGDCDFMYRVLKKKLKVLYTPTLRARHEPDLTVRTIEQTTLSYDAGEAAWHAKYVFRGDLFLLRMFLRRLRWAASLRTCFTALLRGDLTRVRFSLRRVKTLLTAFGSRLIDEWGRPAAD
jgi:glycosyltransferase involved in cell wall biosynthesis